MDPYHRKEATIEVPVDRPSTMDVVDATQNEDMMQLGRFGDGRLMKMEVDYSTQVDEALPKADAIAKSGDVVAAIKSLEPLEKESRLNCDMKSNQRILRHMVKLAFEARNWEALNEQIRLMCKKRSLIKMSIRAMVQDCCAMIDKMPDEKTKNELVEILRLVTEGKIYVEVERARLTKRMADKFEAEGEVDKARELIMELQVETYGSMEVNEKVKYLLHQMRLSITKGDFTRAAIISRKISTKFFEREGEEVEAMKLEFYKYMVDIGLHDESYLDVCKNFLAILNTSRIQADDAKKLEILKCAVFYVLLSQHDNEKWELLHRIHGMRELEQMPEHRALLGLFIRQELIFWSELISGQYAVILGAQPAQIASVDPLLPNTDVFPKSEDGEKRKERLHHCVGEHNVRMIAKYYTRITFQRMAQLLEFDVEKMETFVCKMIVEGVIPEAKIHRPSKIIYMGAKKSSVDTLDQWGSNLRKLTGIMNQVSHLIIKEEMVHGMQISMREE